MLNAHQREVDCQGLSCPLPILKTRKAMDELSSGEILRILSTDPGSVNDLTSWSNTTGHILLSSGEEDGIFVYLIQKK
ncbi:MAG: sulfurtransferase TusA family protein [Candidatus Marinimicrobia bacterium]|nr:sulfurtransferase TusA family protein [Candidatus Neomarinimicrobiota bacterium]